MHFMIPFVQEPRTFQIRAQYQTIHSKTGTKDLQNVDISLRLLYRPVENDISWILNKIGADYDQRIIPSIG